MLFFFFSSRRRHTRSLCDWSSDVCSSDLILISIGPSGLPTDPTRFRISSLGITMYAGPRSEEHTSELQSHSDLVCRLLLEKKKKRRHSTQLAGNDSIVQLQLCASSA